MNKSDAIDILENSSSASNLLQVLKIIEHYDEPATFTNTPLTLRELFPMKICLKQSSSAGNSSRARN